MTATSFVGKVFVVRDSDSRIRRADDLRVSLKYAAGDPIPPGKSVGDFVTIPVGTRVTISEGRAGPNKKAFVLAHAADGAGTALGWTSAGNFEGGLVNETLGEVSPQGNDEKGPNAAWQGGNFIGQKTLVNIVDVGSDVEQITLDSLPAFQALLEAASRDGVGLALRSGFRTFGEQKRLFDGFQAGLPNFATAAAPGRSNHQHGQAFDLNVSEFDGHPIYDWLKKNAPGLGFIRTVKKEAWHWEFRPEEAAELNAEGKHKRAGVNP